MAWTVVLYIFTAFLATVVIYYVFFRQKRGKRREGSPSSHHKQICQSLPLCKKNGWKLSGVEDGVRIWEKNELNTAKFASSTIFAASVKTVADILTDPEKALEWDPSLESLSIISMSNGNDPSSSYSSGDVISVTEVSNSCKVCETISSLISQKDATLHSRTWYHELDTQFWLHSASVGRQNADLLYTMFLVFPTKDKNFCEVTIVCDFDATSTFKTSSLTSKLSGLKDYITSCQYKVVYPEIKAEETPPIADIEENEFDEEDARDPDSSQPPDDSFVPISEAFVDVTGVYLKNDVQRYKPVIDNALTKLMEYYNAKDGDHGWGFVAQMKKVEVLKKPASPGFSAWDCSKGTCEVNVPIHYLIGYCNDLDHNAEYDDMFHTGHLVEQLGDLTTIVYLEYKAIWPVSGRDFCAMNATRILADDLYVVVARSIKHPSCPQSKKYVRGKILMGGFVMKIISEDPPRIMLSYITHVDLAGSVPARIVNKVTANQPLSVGIIKKCVEKMYEEELANPDSGSDYSKKVQITLEKLEKARKVFESRKSSETSETTEQQPQASPSPVSSAKSTPVPSAKSTPVSSANGDLTALKIQNDHHKPITHSASFPVFHSPTIESSPFDNIKAEYKTIGNQASAGLLQEVFEVAETKITNPVASSPTCYERWEYRGTEKDVMMFRKIHANEKMHSIIGKGIIPCSPSIVWEALKSPEQRYHYDNMLKETRILETINESVMIEYLHFETANCFQKQARDFVVLRSHRKEKDKYLLSAISIDYPNTPQKKDVKRGKILASGWVVEPLLHNAQLYSMVTYLSQVNPGGNYPVNLINLVAKKQPLCIAYLRKYLTENRNLNMTL